MGNYINDNYEKIEINRNDLIRTNEIINNNFQNNFIKDISIEPKIKENKEDKEKEILKKQNEEFKSIINQNVKELFFVNKIKNLNRKIQEELNNEKEKVKKILSLNENLQKEKNNLEEKYQKLNNKYENLKLNKIRRIVIMII